MIRKNLLTQAIGLSAIIFASTAFASTKNFECPQAAEIQSTNFTAPSIWLAPPVAHSVIGQVGVGLGGKIVKEFLGVEEAEINNKPGWVCVYRSEGGTSVNDYERRIREITESNRYLKKYLRDVNEAFANAEPYLRNYPQNIPLGFIGYQLEEVSRK